MLAGLTTDIQRMKVKIRALKQKVDRMEETLKMMKRQRREKNIIMSRMVPVTQDQNAIKHTLGKFYKRSI